MSLGGTASYAALAARAGDVPTRVLSAVATATDLDFVFCVRPEVGRLLAVLAAGLPAGARVGETGTGTGAGLAWMVSSAPGATFVSIEREERLVRESRRLFADLDNVEIIHGDSASIIDHGPFDLLVLDGGPGSGKAADTPLDPEVALAPGGTLTIDDFTPTTQWPPLHQGTIDQARVHWLTHPQLRSTEIRVADDVAVLVCRRLDEA